MWASPQPRPHPRVPVRGGPRPSGVWPLHGVIPPRTRGAGEAVLPPSALPMPRGLGCLWCSDASTNSGDRDRSATEWLGVTLRHFTSSSPQLSGDTQAGRPGSLVTGGGSGPLAWPCCASAPVCPTLRTLLRLLRARVLPHCPVASWVAGEGEGVASLQLALPVSAGLGWTLRQHRSHLPVPGGRRPCLLKPPSRFVK